MRSTIIIPTNKRFDHISALRSHGWVDLLPNMYDDANRSFVRIQRLKSGSVVKINVKTSDKKIPNITILIDHPKKISRDALSEVRAIVRYMLRLDEDLEQFFVLCEKKGPPWNVLPQGKGYLLRSPDIFEELVKVICTTNIQWNGTKRMVGELVDLFGEPYSKMAFSKSFPTPKSILKKSLQEFKECVHLGYRAEYIHLLAEKIENQPLFKDQLIDPSLPTKIIKDLLLSIKGIGNYAAATMLMLLGRFNHIPLDTVFRDFMKEKYFQGRQFSEEEGTCIYEEWGKWKYLAYWYDMVNYYHPGEI